MAERNWTAAQKSAIELRGKSLLVSAAAGSGKTAVLTERIIRRICDERDPLDITRCAIVTFTRAAASELRERLSAALTSACRRDPKNRRISSQLVKLSSAKIGTVHSFCFDIIKSNFSALGLKSGVRIADETEIRLHKKSVMNSLIELCYDTPESECAIQNFGAFADLFVSDRDDKLADIFIALYDKLMTIPDGLGLLGRSSDELRSVAGLPTDSWGKVIRQTVSGETSHYARVFDAAVDYMSDGAKLEKNYLPSFVYDRDFALELGRVLDVGSYDDIRATIQSYSPLTLGRGVKKDEQTRETELFKKQRTDFKDRLKKLSTEYFSMSSEVLELSKRESADVIDKLSTLISDFDARFTAEKRRIGILDFADLELMCARLLYNSDGSLSKVAESLRESYDEIYVDEYQDTNELQDMIFSAIARPDNRFMVGDIKQSIYGFRGASPATFAAYREKFAEYVPTADLPENADGLTVFLSNNFRSDRTVIDFVNIVFGCLFKVDGTTFPYTDGDALIYSKGDRDAHPVEVALIEDSEDESVDTSKAEADFVANKISELLDEGYLPGDIAILFRSAKKSAKPFEDALKRLNVPFYNDVTKNFFENPEILLALCLLSVIDNPTRDIYLAGALRSPIFGVTLDELALMRHENPDMPLIDSLRIYTEAHGFEKGTIFLEKLSEWRKYATSKPVDKLIWYLWQESGILGIANSHAKKNLMLLYEYARRFESGSFRGLYNFILYINDILNERATLENAKEFTDADDTVKMMTIHGSKGLEYKVCFICGCDGSFNKGDLKAPILFDSRYGVGFKLRDETGFARFTTPLRQALTLAIDGRSIDEEMRILYVALTRAKERLYVTAAVKNADSAVEDAENTAEFPSRHTLTSGASYIKWILTALKNAPSYGGYTLDVYSATDITAPTRRLNVGDVEMKSTVGNELSEDEFSDEISSRFNFKYPYAKLTSVPAKLTVSRLHPTVLDEDDTSADLELDSAPKLKTPRFLEGTIEATAADRGTATHTFMQFCDYRLVEKYGVDEEIARLVNEQFITEESANLVSRRMLRGFFNSPLYREIAAAKDVRREVRFNIKFPASEFSGDAETVAGLEGEYVLVQGVVDCFFFDAEGRLTLVDYKTDYIPPEIRDDVEASNAFLLERHSRQLNYYREAMKRLTGAPVYRTILYSFALNRPILLPPR